jgi:hypothetical protein
MQVIERKFEMDTLPYISTNYIKGERIYIQAIGVRLKLQKITKEYFLDFAKNYFIAKDSKGNWLNCKIVKTYL